ncbi:hypothetical protein RJ639_027631 [Escallonia herrerae]|uniref:Uncharacterized protein n=1 Tax=Escallonia herrerae TaxID=1293975 RepID=A0AA88X471_9ASTE|nr:hypothetical protein RJ639_027631 [Escallonia herrerae]
MDTVPKNPLYCLKWPWDINLHQNPKNPNSCNFETPWLVKSVHNLGSIADKNEESHGTIMVNAKREKKGFEPSELASGYRHRTCGVPMLGTMRLHELGQDMDRIANVRPSDGEVDKATNESPIWSWVGKERTAIKSKTVVPFHRECSGLRCR